MAASNIAAIERIALALGDLKEKMVFVGGSVAELYADFPEISDIRPTLDVDCVVDIEIRSYFDYSKLENKIRALGFQDDTSDNAPICRKIYQGILVDFMPVFPDILGFSNCWYADGIANKTERILPNGTAIYIMPVEYYLATKFEALNNRGGQDIRGSHDWEDIVYIINNCANLVTAIKQCSNSQLVEYLHKQCGKLLKNNNIRETIYSVLPYYSEEENIDAILKVINEIYEDNNSSISSILSNPILMALITIDIAFLASNF